MGCIETALVSVADRTGLVEFTRELKEFGVKVLATSGTAAFLAESEVKVGDVADLTGSNELLGGLVKTLHPAIHAGILADRTNSSHMRELAGAGWIKIDMVVVNFYPIREVSDRDLSFVDIGGPAMARAAAKNFKSCVPVPSPGWYRRVIESLRRSGDVDEHLRWELAVDTLRLTASYDARILEAVNGSRVAFPDRLVVTMGKAYDLRYGENPHQTAAFYTTGGGLPFEVLKGELSYNNILDVDCCLGQLSEFEKPAAVVVKHVSPCGVAQAASGREALEAAYACDPLSAFGGVIGVNFRFDGACARFLAKKFVECIVAPDFEDDALVILRKKKRTRLIRYHNLDSKASVMRSAAGGLLIQSPDDSLTSGQLDFVCGDKPTDEMLEDLLFAWKVVKYVKSNAIVFASKGRTLGIGAGQPSRVDSTKIAIRKAEEGGHDLEGSVMASDGFFPFPDCIELAHKAGARAVIQPGGSIRDQEVIDAAKSFGLTMALARMRHFRH